MTMPQDLIALMEKQEDLHPDLLPYVETAGKLRWPTLRHPLVFSVPYSKSMNAYLNQQYAQKVELLQRAEEEQNWSQVIWLHERPYRLQALLGLMPTVKGTPFWELMGMVWTDTESPHVNRKTWRGLFTVAYADQEGKAMMDSGEQMSLMHFSPTIPIYRGANAPEKRPGLSWTRDRERAVFFARRFERPGPFLWTLQCPRERIVAFFNGRNEHEVVVLDTRGATKELLGEG